MVAIEAERLRKLTPTGYISRDLATKLLSSHYNDDKLDYHVGRLWGRPRKCCTARTSTS